MLHCLFMEGSSDVKVTGCYNPGATCDPILAPVSSISPRRRIGSLADRWVLVPEIGQHAHAIEK
jgi:hypothetical protein